MVLPSSLKWKHFPDLLSDWLPASSASRADDGGDDDDAVTSSDFSYGNIFIIKQCGKTMNSWYNKPESSTQLNTEEAMKLIMWDILCFIHNVLFYEMQLKINTTFLS